MQTNQKTCKRCLKSKPLTSFPVEPRVRDGRAARCKDCRGQCDRENRDRLRAYNTEWARRNPDKVKASSKRRYAKHREAIVKRSTDYRLRNPNRRHANDLFKKYGITAEDYDRLLHAQGGHCALCAVTPAQNGRRRRLAVDHDHLTEEVRGLLCDKHNRAIGMFGDDAELLTKAAMYLSEHQQALIQIAA